jgi:hypothetical protein
MLSFFKFPKWALDLINAQIANCMWDDVDGNKKIHLANWPSICMRKEYGGLGIPNLQDLNICLVGSWVKRYIYGEGRLWKSIVDAKYNTRNPNIFCCQDINPSVFWKGMMWASRAEKFGYKWKIGNGRTLRFWEDTWFGNAPLSTQYWDIYFVVNQQMKTVADLWDGQQLKCDFRRTFTPQMMEMWLEICEIAQSITFSMEEDLLIWKYESKGVYSSKSLYAIINFRGVQPVFLPAVWDLKIPPRVQIFLWLLSQNKIMTRDNLRHRCIQKTLQCELCSELESVKHLFFDCLVSRLLWSVV